MAGLALVAKLEDLAAIDADVHWFCPRAAEDDDGGYFDEDSGDASKETAEEKAVRRAKISEALKRQDDALEVCLILAFDGADAVPYQEKLKRCLQAQLTRCDICVREFHRARRRLRNQLENEYPADEVENFMRKFDEMNNDRIAAGLNTMTEILMDMPPEERKITAVGNIGMYAMFEALHCIPFLRHEELLQERFDKPFRLVQTRKKMKLPSFAPGMAAFLYSNSPERLAWAERNVGGLKRMLTKEEFEHCVKPFLINAMARVNPISLDLEFLPTYWRATRHIISKCNKELVTDNLRQFDVNFFTLALDHFQIESPHFVDLLASFQMLLELAGRSFWDGMGSASPQNVVETICKAPGLETLLTTRLDSEPLELEDKMGWVNDFIRSIKPANLVPPLRTLLDQLLHNFQADKYSNYASSVMWEKGLVCLEESIGLITNSVDGGPVYVHLVEAVAKDHIEPILAELAGIETKDEIAITKTQMLDLDIITKILATDIKGLGRDRRYIERNFELDHELGTTSLNLWKMTMRSMKSGKPALPIAVLSGIKGLLQLDQLPPTTLKRAPRTGQSWNNAIGRLQNYVISDLLGRLESHSPDQLAGLFQEQEGARGLMALLFNANDHIHDGALSLLKTFSGEDSRRDSLMHVTSIFCSTALNSAAEALRLVSEARIYGPCLVSLKLCRDIFGCLCDSGDGVLRSTNIPGDRDMRALRSFWNATWSALEMMFEMTEAWSGTGLDKSKMQDFCRETMDFADYAFDQYAIIAGTLEANGATVDSSKRLLELPNRAFKAIMKWLRLRDDYLITKAVSLTSKMLVRLQEVGLVISPDAAQYIEDIVTANANEKHTKVKTRLSTNHKAELQRALERHTGATLSDAIALAKKKQATMQTFLTAGRDTKSGSTTPTLTAKPKGTIDLAAWSSAAQEQAGRPKMKSVSELQKKAEQEKKLKEEKNRNEFLAKRKAALAETQKQKEATLAKMRAQGAGSGVVGLGNLGADHGSKQTVMVDSEDDESDSDDDEMDDELFGSTSKPKRQVRPALDLSGAVGLKPEVKKGPVRINRQARSAKDMRARLAPDLGPLHRIMLGWDVFVDGVYPPGYSESDFDKVADQYRDPSSYQNTFERLLILEAWQGMLKEREENSSKPYDIKVQSRSNVDNLIEISSILGQQENRELSLSEGDIIILSKSQKPLKEPEEAHCLARVYRIKRQKQHLEVVYQISPTNNPLVNQLTMQTVVHGLKLQSITPLEREYGALKALTYYDLCNQITRAKPSAKLDSNDRQVQSYQDIWNLNRAQAEATNGALENDGFSLIQGPPGSGKTKTIVAIVGGLLSTVLGKSVHSTTRIAMPKAAGATNGVGEVSSKKLLVCAPSNAAVDEIVMRLKSGVKTKSGSTHQINVVRLGRSDAINTQVRDVTMDELVQKYLGGGNEADEKKRLQDAETFKEHESVSAHLRDLYQQRDAADASQTKLDDKQRKALEDSIVSVRRKKALLGTRIDSVKDEQRNAGREQELNRRRAQQAVLDKAHVICATLSGSGHDMFQSLSIEFETVVIDEAAQCVEVSSLIPLKYGCVKCIMVGDPKQLPPTVFSKEAASFQYEQSLFVRMQNNSPRDVYLLDTQYRMHPDISVFPSRTFYDGLLKDGDGMARLRTQPWHKSALLAPYNFFDVSGQHEAAPKGHSLVNRAEINIAELLYDRLRTDFPTYDFTGKIGIITPYKSQLRELKSRFQSKYGQDIFDFIEFNTTDAFQGRESEIIIFSCVRASPAGGIGFLQDIRRMNVGLTRAKSSLWVLGNSQSLERGRYWKMLVQDARDRDALITGNLKKMLQLPSGKFPAASSKPSSMSDIGNHVPQMDPIHSNGTSRASSVADARPVQQAQTTQPPQPKPDLSKSIQNGSDPDRMDGVSYAYKDRVNKYKQPQPDRPSSGSGSMAATPDGDVDMEDVVAEPEPITIDDEVPTTRSATPLSGTEARQAPTTRPEGAGATTEKPRGALVPTGGAAPAVKRAMKRPAQSSPFLPKKRPGQR